METETAFIERMLEGSRRALEEMAASRIARAKKVAEHCGHNAVGIGELYVLSYTANNNHGCSGHRVVVEAITPTTGLVVDVADCPNHDGWWPVSGCQGKMATLPERFCWCCASENLPMAQFDLSRVGQTSVYPLKHWGSPAPIYSNP